MRMQEQGAVLPGSVGEVVGQGFRRIADELSDVVDLVIQRNVTQSLQGAAEVATSADEPKRRAARRPAVHLCARRFVLTC